MNKISLCKFINFKKLKQWTPKEILRYKLDHLTTKVKLSFEQMPNMYTITTQDKAEKYLI